MLLQTNFDALTAPEVLTTELSIILSVLIIVMLYASIRYRSLFSMFGWMLMVVALILTFFTNIRLLWFWLAVIGEAFMLVLAAITYARMAARQ